LDEIVANVLMVGCSLHRFDAGGRRNGSVLFGSDIRPGGFGVGE